MAYGPAPLGQGNSLPQPVNVNMADSPAEAFQRLVTVYPTVSKYFSGTEELNDIQLVKLSDVLPTPKFKDMVYFLGLKKKLDVSSLQSKIEANECNYSGNVREQKYTALQNIRQLSCVPFTIADVWQMLACHDHHGLFIPALLPDLCQGERGLTEELVQLNFQLSQDQKQILLTQLGHQEPCFQGSFHEAVLKSLNCYVTESDKLTVLKRACIKGPQTSDTIQRLVLAITTDCEVRNAQIFKLARLFAITAEDISKIKESDDKHGEIITLLCTKYHKSASDIVEKLYSIEEDQAADAVVQEFNLPEDCPLEEGELGRHHLPQLLEALKDCQSLYNLLLVFNFPGSCYRTHPGKGAREVQLQRVLERGLCQLQRKENRKKRLVLTPEYLAESLDEKNEITCAHGVRMLFSDYHRDHSLRSTDPLSPLEYEQATKLMLQLNQRKLRGKLPPEFNKEEFMKTQYRPSWDNLRVATQELDLTFPAQLPPNFVTQAPGVREGLLQLYTEELSDVVCNVQNLALYLGLTKQQTDRVSQGRDPRQKLAKCLNYYLDSPIACWEGICTALGKMDNFSLRKTLREKYCPESYFSKSDS